MSEADLKLIRMLFLKENGAGKLSEENLKVYVYSGQKCTTFLLLFRGTKIIDLFYLSNKFTF